MFTWRQSASGQSEFTSRANKSSRLSTNKKKKITKESRKESNKQTKQENHPTANRLLLLSSSLRLPPPMMAPASPA